MTHFLKWLATSPTLVLFFYNMSSPLAHDICSLLVISNSSQFHSLAVANGALQRIIHYQSALLCPTQLKYSNKSKHQQTFVKITEWSSEFRVSWVIYICSNASAFRESDVRMSNQIVREEQGLCQCKGVCGVVQNHPLVRHRIWTLIHWIDIFTKVTLSSRVHPKRDLENYKTKSPGAVP